MKITKEHVAIMEIAINEVLAKYPNLVTEYENGNFPRADKVKDLQKRFCFDLMFGAGLNSFVCDTISPYANGTHLFTALKSICPKVTRKY